MKVCELIEMLESCDPSLEVILQKDSEGNGYNPLYSVDDECIYVKEDRSVVSLNWGAKGACMSEQEWDSFIKRERCVVLAP